MHQNAPFIPLNIKNRLPKEGGTPLLQPPPLASCGCSCRRRPFRLFLQNFLLFSNLSTSLGCVQNVIVAPHIILDCVRQPNYFLTFSSLIPPVSGAYVFCCYIPLCWIVIFYSIKLKTLPTGLLVEL